MKITTNFDATFISVSRLDYKDKEGRPSYANYIALEAQDDVGKIRCTDAVKENLEKEKKYTSITFQGVYDSFNKDLVITGFKKEN